MRDQFDAEIWNAHHDRFSQWLSGGAARTGASLGRMLRAVRVPAQFAAAIAAVSLAGLSLGSIFV